MRVLEEIANRLRPLVAADRERTKQEDAEDKEMQRLIEEQRSMSVRSVERAWGMVHPGAATEPAADEPNDSWADAEYPFAMFRNFALARREVVQRARAEGLIPRYSIGALHQWYAEVHSDLSRSTLPTSPQLWVALALLKRARDELDEFRLELRPKGAAQLVCKPVVEAVYRAKRSPNAGRKSGGEYDQAIKAWMLAQGINSLDAWEAREDRGELKKRCCEKVGCTFQRQSTFREALNRIFRRPGSTSPP
jgi:hypothetical protein